jgi:hypothetical protein
MARIEAPAGAKAAGNSYSPEPVVTAPVVDSTEGRQLVVTGPLFELPQSRLRLGPCRLGHEAIALGYPLDQTL